MLELLLPVRSLCYARVFAAGPVCKIWCHLAVSAGENLQGAPGDKNTFSNSNLE